MSWMGTRRRTAHEACARHPRTSARNRDGSTELDQTHSAVATEPGGFGASGPHTLLGPLAEVLGYDRSSGASLASISRRVVPVR